MTKHQQLLEIDENIVNGNLRDAVKLVDEYGNYDFWSDWWREIKPLADNSHETYINFVQAYHRIKNR